MSPGKRKERNCQSSNNHYEMGTNFSGWGYPLSQTLTFSSRLPGIGVDVNSTSGSATAGIRGDLPLFPLVFLFEEDDDDTGADSSKVGLGQYIGGLSVIIE